MIALFRANLPDQGAEVADMRSLSLARRFGGLIAWDSFFHLAHGQQRQMFPVFRDHARPGARCCSPAAPPSERRSARSRGSRCTTRASVPANTACCSAATVFDVAAPPEDPGCGGRTVWLARRR